MGERAATASRRQALSVASAAPLLTMPGSMVRGTVVARPSKTIKSPYLADVLLEDGTAALAHTPALGCGGLVAAGAAVWMRASASSRNASSHTIYHVILPDGSLVCTHPLVANALARAALTAGLVAPGALSGIKAEVHVEELVADPDAVPERCRVDFVGQFDGCRVLVEVKNVPLKAADASVGVFPDGCDGRKKSRAAAAIEPISPRAVKHALMLARQAALPATVACLLYVCQRADVTALRVNPRDPIYCAAVKAAADSGVLVQALSVRWDPGDPCVAWAGSVLPVVYE